jgi:hypothetical protein
MRVPNPGYSEGAAWTGLPLPQTQTVANVEICLASVKVASQKAEYWRSASPYWEPQFELRLNGRLQSGWKTDWTAEDRYGNHGQHLGLAEPVLKFNGVFHPQPTNFFSAVLITNAPVFGLPRTNDSLWNLSVLASNLPVKLLGVFPAGVYTFSEGEYLTNPPLKLGAMKGGAPSGWVGASRREGPSRTRSYRAHYSDVPVILIQIPSRADDELFGLRLTDEGGHVFGAEREPEGSAARILPFLVRVPPESKHLRPELLYLRPVTAEFLVQLPRPDK